MHEKEIQYFTEAFKLAKDKFYIDAIHQFQSLIKEFSESDLADDALYNVVYLHIMFYIIFYIMFYILFYVLLYILFYILFYLFLF